MQQVCFISKASNWQKYRNDILLKLTGTYDVRIQVLTTGSVKSYIRRTPAVAYRSCKSWLPLQAKFSFFPGALWQIIKDSPDAVLCLTDSAQLTEHLALPICKALHIRYVYWTHGYHHGKPIGRRLQERFRSRLQIFLIKQADAVIAFSEKGRDYLVSQGVATSKVFHAPNTLDTDALLKSARETYSAYGKEVLASEFGLLPHTEVVLFSGRLLHEKKVDNAILAVERAIRIRPQTHLLIVGDGPARTYLEELATAHIPGHVTFLGEVFDEEVLAKVFALSRLFVMPGYVGLAIVHAFCFGLPIITENISTHRPEIQFLKPGINGFFVDEDDIEGLATRIVEILDDPAKLNAMSTNALNTVRTEANVALMIEVMATALGLSAKRSSQNQA